MSTKSDNILAPVTAKSPAQVLELLCEEPWIPESVLRATYKNITQPKAEEQQPE
jgi:hypothetical protein